MHGHLVSFAIFLHIYDYSKIKFFKKKKKADHTELTIMQGSDYLPSWTTAAQGQGQPTGVCALLMLNELEAAGLKQ